jgi:hypothetical protein
MDKTPSESAAPCGSASVLANVFVPQCRVLDRELTHHRKYEIRVVDHGEVDTASASQSRPPRKVWSSPTTHRPDAELAHETGASTSTGESVVTITVLR